jgi:hypothetical protein
VEILFADLDLSSPVRHNLCQLPDRIEEIARSEDHDEEAVLYQIPADSGHISPELSWVCEGTLIGHWPWMAHGRAGLPMTPMRRK